MAVRDWFLPHKETHKKAHLISWEGLIIYILLFILLQVGFSIINYAKPGVLGITGNIDQKKLIELSNLEREKKGLPRLVENEALDKAAQLKAQNMFEENYWSHFAPSGKSPWDFILGSGYKFSYAGENLARNFYNSEDVVNSWMGSQTHRDNILNPKYQDIGIAAVEGVLNGQKTILVVQEFGSTEFTQTPVVDVSGKQITVPESDFNNKPDLVAAAVQTPQAKAILDPHQVLKYASVSVIVLMIVLLSIDLYVLKKRGVFRLSSHHVAHMALLSLTASTLFMTSPGSVL